MDPLRWQRIGELFAVASLQDRERRIAFLKDNCGQDQDLFEQLKSLLEIDDRHGVLECSPTVSTLGIPNIVAGRFRIIRCIAEGGMGTVYEAEDLQLHDNVALKTIRPAIASNPRAVERFRQEIRLGKRVTHPNICRIYDLGTDRSESGAEFLFLTMQFLGGETLSSRIRRGPLPQGEALPLIEDMADALSAAHQAEVIHRDFKSGNVMLVRGANRTCAVVTDFGLARGINDSASLTQSGLVGTVDYMAPEQITGGEISPATDIYAFGVVMYEMVTGHLPFIGDSNGSVLRKHLNDEPQPPRVWARHLDAKWNEAILGCLRKLPSERFQSAAEVKDALVINAARPRKHPGSQRRIKPALLATIAVLLLAIAMSVWFYRRETAFAKQQAMGWIVRMLNVNVRSSKDVIKSSVPTAYEAYLKALDYIQRYDKPGNLDLAISQLQLAVLHDPQFAIGYAELGEAFRLKYQQDHEKKWIAEALANAKKASELNNRLPAVYVTLGRIHNDSGNYDLAAAEFQRALDLDSRNAEALDGMAYAYEEAGRFAEAEAAYQNAVALRPESWDAYNTLGSFYVRQRRFDDAIAQFQRAVQLTPDNTESYNNLAGAYMNSGKTQYLPLAEKSLKKSLTLVPTYPAFANLGYLYLLQERYAESAAMSRSALRMNDQDFLVWENLEWAYRWLADTKRSLEASDRVLSLLEEAGKSRPRDAQVQSHLAYQYALRNRSGDALVHLRTALVLSPDDPDVLVNVSEAYGKLGDRKRALQYAELSLEKGYTIDDLRRDPDMQGILSDPEFRFH